MFQTETLQRKWAPVLDHPELPKIGDTHRRAVTAAILENQERAFREENNLFGQLNEATPGLTTGYTGGAGEAATKAGYDPILISLIRRSLPNLMAYDICGVQPMNGPTGLIFAMRATYTDNAGADAFFNEANTVFSGELTGTHTSLSGVNPTDNTNFTTANTGVGMSTLTGENDISSSMGFSIEKVTVTAKTRQLKASYSIELAQDLKAIHGLDAETELSNILSTEILAEINREVVRTIYATAKVGGPSDSGAMNLNSTAVADGRWQVEKFKNLIFAIERDSNKIARDTRRGKGNMIICSSDVASALAMSGLLDYQSGLTGQTNLEVDPTGNTFVGTLFGRIKVFIDPYSVSNYDYVITGYKGTAVYDAGLFYCPYVPLQMVRAIDPNNFQPKIGFKTRYGMVANPFSRGAVLASGDLATGANVYYRKFQITNLK
jgi:hypothetical protein